VSEAAPPFDLATDEGARRLLEALVRLPSPSGAERGVAEALVAALTPYADEAFVDEAGNAVAVAGGGPRKLTLLAHVDTVPGAPPVRVEGGVLHGRGAVDAKGSAVALAVALARAPAQVREATTLRFVGAVEEEVETSRGARHALIAYPRPDLLIVGEPSGWDAFTLGYKGSLRMRLRSERDAAHGAREDVTASEALVAAWLALRGWAEAVTPRDPGGAGAFDRLQVALLGLASDHDGLREGAEAAVGWRLPVAWPPGRLLAALADVDLGPGVGVDAWGGEAAVRGRRDGELARAFRTAIRSVGGTPGSKVKTGTSDWNVVAPVWRCDTVAYGPGDASLDHTPDERLALVDLDRSIAVLERVLALVAGPRTTGGAGGRTDPRRT
jgi:[amino group carrier protein]-lysine/ornithine hydrolase